MIGCVVSKTRSLPRSFALSLTFLLSLGLFAQQASAQEPVKLAVVGLVHDHIIGLLSRMPNDPRVKLVGIAEPNAALREKYAKRYHLAPELFFPSESAMLAATHPQAILVYTSIAGHRAAIEEAAKLGISAMVEKPLATTYADALAIQRIAEAHHVSVLTNYETTWYDSNAAAGAMLESGKIGPLRKLVVHDGHNGPKEIGVSPDFLGWLTDPVQNGAGAMFDFGCYGVDLSTWLMRGEAPISVTATALHIKPEVYPKVEDDSTILLTYPHAQAIIQGSWNWPFSRKDMEVYGSTGYIDTVDATKLRVRLPGEKEEHAETAPPLPAPRNDSLDYLAAVLNHQLEPDGDLTSLKTNMIVMQILDAARESARTGKTVVLAKH